MIGEPKVWRLGEGREALLASDIFENGAGMAMHPDRRAVETGWYVAGARSPFGADGPYATLEGATARWRAWRESGGRRRHESEG